MQSALVSIFDDLRIRGGLKASDVANITGKSRATISRWTNGQAFPHPKTQILISDLRYIVDRLAEFYTAEEARLWLYSRHPLLDEKTPIELIFDQRADEVLVTIEQLSESPYL
jgi:transcriptional regulator with XRE-family HTH domain